MDLWDEGRHLSLVDDTVVERSLRRGPRPARDEESAARAYNARVLGGYLRQAVRTLTDRGQGGVLQPDDRCTLTGRPVLEVLRAKHPALAAFFGAPTASAIINTSGGTGKTEDSATAIKNNAQVPPGRSAQLRVQS